MSVSHGQTRSRVKTWELWEVWQVIHQGFWRERFHYKDEEWHVVVLAMLHKLERQKDFWRHRETWPTSQEARSLGLVEQMLHRWACVHPHTHTHAHKHTNTHARVHLPRMHTFYSCLYFPLNYPQKENQWCRNFSRVSFGFVGVHRRELMWPSERGCSMTKGGGVSGSFRSYLLPQYTSATLLLLCKVDVGKTKWWWAQENH